MRSYEDEIGEEPGESAVAINERMNANRVRMNGNAEFASCPIVGVLSAIRDRNNIRGLCNHDPMVELFRIVVDGETIDVDNQEG